MARGFGQMTISDDSGTRLPRYRLSLPNSCLGALFRETPFRLQPETGVSGKAFPNRSLGTRGMRGYEIRWGLSATHPRQFPLLRSAGPAKPPFHAFRPAVLLVNRAAPAAEGAPA